MQYRIDRYSLQGEFIEQGNNIFEDLESAKKAYLQIDRVMESRRGFLYRVQAIEGCKHCIDLDHWHKDENQIVKTCVMITSKVPHRLVISQYGMENFTLINNCPFCGKNLEEK